MTITKIAKQYEKYTFVNDNESYDEIMSILNRIMKTKNLLVN